MLAQIEEDVDGDGALDRVSVASTGELVIHGSRPTVLPLRPDLVRAAVAAKRVRAVPTLVVTTTSPTDERTFVFVRDGDNWRELTNERTGPVGEDGEYAIALAADETGVLRYQTRPGLRRCDGKPGYLFAEGWNGKRFQRLSKIPANVTANSPVIAARAEPSAPPAPLLYQARTASHQTGAADAAALTVPTEISDGAATTFWREGFSGSAGEGQFFTFEPRTRDARANRIRIVPGNPTTARTMRAFNRPRRIAIVGASRAWHIDLPDAAAAPLGTAYVADLPSPIDGCVTIILESTYGPPNGTTAIAELAVFAEAERNGDGEAALARAIGDGADGVNAAGRALAHRGASAVAAIDQELQRAADAPTRHRLARALIGIQDPAAGPSIARALTDGAVHERDVQQAVRALAAMGHSAHLHQVVSRNDLALPTRVAAARALAGDDKLVGLAGQGPHPLRRAVVEAMSAIAVPVLVAAARDATTPAAAGDLWRAVTRPALTATNAERADAVTAMLAELSSASDYELRYRLVEGVATLGDATALEALQTQLSQLPQHHTRATRATRAAQDVRAAQATRAALGHVAARAIARHPRPDAATLLLWLVAKPDPGVRAEALSALGEIAFHRANAIPGRKLHSAVPRRGLSMVTEVRDAPDRVQYEIDRAVATALASDRWPEVRRDAARAFSKRCAGPHFARHLTRSVRRDPDLGVRRAALSALVECRAARTGELLATMWSDPKHPLALRRHAIDLSAVLKDRATSALLATAFDNWRNGAAESDADLALAQSAALALGRLAPPGAAAALLRALTAANVPDLVAAAASGLGAMGPSCPASARRRLQSLAQAAAQQVRVAAAQAAVQCGK